jgi:hypothetical protein
MIPRYQRIVYWILVGGILLMLLLLIYGCEHKHSRNLAMRDESRIAAPTDLPAQQVSLALANDADASIILDDISMPLPADPSLRARLILDRMFSDFALPASTHPLPSGKAVTDVFLLPLPLVNPGRESNDADAAQHASPYGHVHMPDAQLAVVNLTKSFADAHPSGIETEDLTLRAIIATLHANLPQVEQIRFLVDGQPRPTLAGHADLTRPYAVIDPIHSIHVLSAFGNPM